MPNPTRSALTTALLGLACTAATAAPATAAPPVCNQASVHFLGGGLVALDPPTTSPAARYTVDLAKLPGKGAGLVGAAANSPSLTICGPADTGGGGGDPTVIDPGTGGTVDIGGGIVSAV